MPKVSNSLRNVFYLLFTRTNVVMKFKGTERGRLLLSVTEHEYMQINGSRIYVTESRGVIRPMFLRVRGFMGFVVS